VAYPDAPAEAWRSHGLALHKEGRSGEAKAALGRYLQMKPAAPDAPFIRQMVG
jgi:Flp pilus assembly protein TadD